MDLWPQLVQVFQEDFGVTMIGGGINICDCELVLSDSGGKRGGKGVPPTDIANQ